MIHVHRLTKQYGRTPVLDDIDMRVEPGEVVLLHGANGAGKSTLFRCILGLETYVGEIRVDGLDPLRRGKEVRRRIGYMPQTAGLHADLGVWETLAFYAALRGVPESDGHRLLHDVRLAEVADLGVAEVSGGMRQRLAFAVALLGDPPVLLLDEPTASLDGWSRDVLVSKVRELAARGKTIVLSTHAEHTLLRETARALSLREGHLFLDDGAPIGARALRPPAVPTPVAGPGSAGWVIDSRGRVAGGGRCE